MAINNIATTERNSMCDALVDAIDAGSAGGIIEIYTAAFGTRLAVLTFSTTAFGAAASGVATASAITDESAAITNGTAAVCRISSSNAADTALNTVFEGTVGTSGADINLTTTSIATNDVVSISSMTVTMPAS